ncbi:PREDICTED: uncharacterized protein LOC106749902 isoform X2 [Dinoponera quadriceps]|uniref:Uncharacterized protein LOC106749902 isoform X2 n=1 Tax=Dinoponera quadriceps TaxID=609295 RepID=A0A6P3Y391_DINQU|nr:PREDICTED: uncharacterized protein LOC106749902 isoform X2 [Dinoponera quadriceps]
MSDLIDLNSPDVKRSVNPKLSSPLIPAPGNVAFNEQAGSSSTKERCESLGSNPFDNLLHETVEYMKKKGDPFEVMLQRALRCKSNRSSELKAQSVIFSDDSTPRRRKKFLKINKTLDESLIEENKTSSTSRERQKEIASNLAARKDALSKGFLRSANSTFKPHSDLPRSLSQADRTSLRKSQCSDRKSQSVTDTSTISRVSQSNSSALLSSSNRVFLESKQSQRSVFLDLSDVSSTARLNSVSLVSNLSSVSSSGVLKNASLDSGFTKTSNEKINAAENSTEVKSIQSDLSELTERHTLNYGIHGTSSILSLKEETDQSNSMNRENMEQTANNKLIDIDVFMLESRLNKKHNKSMNSTGSSLDSVFIDNSKVDKLILNEAKALSRIFTELSLEVNSVSGGTDDLISNDTLWMSELLPAFEDEFEDNLIELPVSPEKSVKNDKSDQDPKQSPASIVDNAGEVFLREIESQLADRASTGKRTIVATLLSDLKRLVRADDNREVGKLIDNLESALGVRHKNNAELLASLSNELRTSERSDDDKLDNTERSASVLCVNGSQEESTKMSCEERVCDNKGSLHTHTSHKSGDTSQATTVSSDDSLARVSPCNNNENRRLDIRTSSEATLGGFTKDKSNQPDEELAVELLVNLGKLLRGQAEDTTILRLLKNIGKALNLASNNCKVEGESARTDGELCDDDRRIPSPSEISPESERSDARPAGAIEATHERSFKSQSLEGTRKRVSIVRRVHSSNADTSNAQVNAKGKGMFELKSQKRFSYNLELENIRANKKFSSSRTSNTKIAETAELDNRSKKPLAIIDIRNKLKKKSDMVGKSGPVKAMHLVGTMQKKVSRGKQTASSFQATTPPKSNAAASFGNKIISSTPNSATSSTPDNREDGTRSRMQFKSTDKKRNFSCDISPVSKRKGGSPRRSVQPPPPSAKICTPKRQRANSSGIPKYCTPPRKFNSSLDTGRHQQSPQCLNKSLSSCPQRYSPVCPNSAEKCLQSPLKESNKSFTKVKPFKLISKLKEITAGDLTEKENYSQ